VSLGELGLVSTWDSVGFRLVGSDSADGLRVVLWSLVGFACTDFFDEISQCSCHYNNTKYTSSHGDGFISCQGRGSGARQMQLKTK